MSSYPSNSYPAMPSSSSNGNGGGDVDVDAFPLPPNLRSMSMSEPIVDPDFGWFDPFPSGPFDFASSPSADSTSSSSGSVGQSYEWYDPLPPAASVPYPADGARPHPAHAHNVYSAPQPAHGLAPIIPPQQRPVPPQHAHFAHSPQQHHLAKADYAQPVYSQPQPRQKQPQPPLYDQPPQYQHAASFPPPSYPPQQPPSQQQAQPAHTYAQQHTRRASTPSQSYPMQSAGGTPAPYSGGRQSMYGAGDHSPVSHVSSASSLSSHSSSSSDNGADGARQQKRKHSTDSTAGEVNGLEHSPTETAAVGGATKGKGRGGGGAGSKKQRSQSTTNTNNNGNHNTNNKASKANAKPAHSSTATTTTATASKPTTKAADSTTTATTAPAASTADIPSGVFGCFGDNPTALTSVQRSTERGDVAHVAWPMLTSTYNNMQQYFVSLILAMVAPDNQSVTDIIHLIAHAMEVAPAKPFTNLLRCLGYVPQPAAADSHSSSEDRVVWRTPNPLLPYMTLPHHFRLNWSVSPETTLAEDTTLINFPTLCWWRAKEVRFVRRPDGSVQAIETHFHPNPNCTPAVEQTTTDKQQQPADSPFSTGESSATTPSPTPTPQTPATPSTEPPSPASPATSPPLPLPSLPPASIDMSVLDLPCHVEVNSAFERMFGYSQSEIRILFIRHGKQALARLADAQQFRQCHELSMRDACEGQHEFSHVIDVRPKYGGSMKTIMHHKLVVGNEGLVWKKLYMWIPLTKGMKDAYLVSSQQQAAAGQSSAAAGAGSGAAELGKDGLRTKVEESGSKIMDK